MTTFSRLIVEPRNRSVRRSFVLEKKSCAADVAEEGLYTRLSWVLCLRFTGWYHSVGTMRVLLVAASSFFFGVTASVEKLAWWSSEMRRLFSLLILFLLGRSHADSSCDETLLWNVSLRAPSELMLSRRLLSRTSTKRRRKTACDGNIHLYALKVQQVAFILNFEIKVVLGLSTSIRLSYIFG